MVMTRPSLFVVKERPSALVDYTDVVKLLKLAKETTVELLNPLIRFVAIAVKAARS